jgi:ribosomal protein S1
MVVKGFNRGGVLVSGAGLQGFVPISHLVEVPCQESDTEIWLEKFVDRTLDLKVIECDQDRGRALCPTGHGVLPAQASTSRALAGNARLRIHGAP